jgi:hypothetical protein
VAQIFHIPFAFEFRKVSVQWAKVFPTVVGWAKQQDGAVDPLHLIAEIEGKAGVRQIKLPVSHLSEADRELCRNTARELDAEEAVRKMCASVQPVVFTHTRKTYLSDAELLTHSVPADAAQMRADFLRLDGDPEATLAFLNNWGRWLPHRNFVDAGELLELQHAVRQALTASPEQWLSTNYSDLPRAQSRSKDCPYFTALTDACQVAIRLTTTFDVLQRTEFRVCARPDCAVPFAVKTKHNRRYCTQYCAHLESVRRGRTTQRSR